MVTATVLLDCDVTLRALLRVGGDPVGSFRIVVTLFDPLLQQPALYRVVPVFATLEAEHVVALADNRSRIDVLHPDRVRAVGRRAPS